MKNLRSKLVVLSLIASFTGSIFACGCKGSTAGRNSQNVTSGTGTGSSLGSTTLNG